MNRFQETVLRTVTLASVLAAIYLVVVLAFNWDAVERFSAIRD